MGATASILTAQRNTSGRIVGLCPMDPWLYLWQEDIKEGRFKKINVPTLNLNSQGYWGLIK